MGALSTSELTADEILARTEDRYRTCGTYHDTALTREELSGRSGNSVTEWRIKNSFMRGEVFRFEYSKLHRWPHPRPNIKYVAWQRGTDVRTWWDVRPGVENPPLVRELGAQTGVSRLASVVVPDLLLEGRLFDGRCGSQPTSRRKDEPCGTAMCTRLDCYLGGSPMTLWIDLDTFLIRRIEDGEDTITYDPVINAPIPEEDPA